MGDPVKASTEIFDAFLCSNVHQGRRYDVDDLMTIDKEREFRYTADGEHFLATASRADLWKGPCVTIAIRTRLPELESQPRRWLASRFMGDGIGRYFHDGGCWFSSCPDSMTFVLAPKDARNLLCKISFVRGEPFATDDDVPA